MQMWYAKFVKVGIYIKNDSQERGNIYANITDVLYSKTE